MAIDKLSILFLLFIIYSALGWMMETIAVFIESKKLVDRGFLIGPYCPIYGVGCILIIVILTNFLDYPVLLFILSALICSIVEYLTSFFMEKLFKARWWDYSDRKFNLNGRICLSNSVIFGILGWLILYFLNPAVYKLISYIPNDIRYIVSGIILILFLVDVIISCNLMTKIKKFAFESNKDNTEEITKKIKEILFSKNVLIKRIIEASPNVKNSIKNKIAELNTKRKSLEKKIASDMNNIKNGVKEKIKSNVGNKEKKGKKGK